MEIKRTEEEVVSLLKAHGLKLTTAESCTGGMFTARIVDVSGASEVLEEGFITYSNRAKHKNLGVSSETLEKYTAVSEQTAREMASGVATKTKSEAAIAITGYAGPYAGDDGTPAGTVYIGCYVLGDITVRKFSFLGSRQEVREQAVNEAMSLLKNCLLQKIK